MHSQLKKWQRISLVFVFALFISGLMMFKGDVASVIAQGVPHIDEVIGQLDAKPGFINSYVTKDGRMAMEVTEDHFGKDFLVVVQMAKGLGEGFLLTGYPLDTKMMTFRKRNGKIELITRSTYFRADEGTPEGRMVDLGFRDAVRATFSRHRK